MPGSRKGWFSQAHKHIFFNISITSENTPDISISRKIRRTNPLTCLMPFSLLHEHKHKHKKNEHVCFSSVYLCLRLCASENSIRQVSEFVFLLMLTLMSQVFSVTYAYVVLMLVLM